MYVYVCVFRRFFIRLSSKEKRGVRREFLIVLGEGGRREKSPSPPRGIDILDWSTLALNPLAVVLSAQLWLPIG